MPEIKNVEIMAEGTWNGNKITKETLQQIVDAFEKTKDFAKPVLKLGHNEDQKLLAADGLPAAGWVQNVYIKGKKLLADFVDIPDKIFQLIQKKAYRKVSVELFSGYKFENETFPTLLGAVALLGSDLPAVANLRDILSNYSLEGRFFTTDENAGKIKSSIIEMNIGDKPVSEKQTDVSEFKKLIEDQQKEIEKLSQQIQNFDSEKQNFSQYKEETEKRLQDLINEKEKTKLENFCLELSKEDLLAPSMKPLVEALLPALKDKKEFSVGEKKVEAQELVKNLLSLAKECFSINQEAKTKDAKPEASKDSEIEEAIQKEMQENQALSYSDAYKKVYAKLKA